MSYNTIIEQGSFIATGTTSSTVIAPVTIKTDIGPDWVEVWNYTQFGNGSNPANTGFRFYWQKGMPNFSALSDAQLTINNKAVSAYKLTTGGIAVIDTSIMTPETAIALATTFVTQANPALVTTASPNGYATGDIIRIYGTTDMQQIASMDFTIDVVSTTTFHLTYLDASGFAAAASAGFVERVNDWMFYPRWRYITAMSAVAPSSTLVRVKLSVTHNFTVGQLISFRIPAVWGKSANAAYDTQYAIIEAVNAAGTTNTIDVNFNNNSVTGTPITNAAASSFAFPTSAVAVLGISFAMVVPVGEDTGTAIANNVTVLGDAEENRAAINIVLGTGDGTVSGPAGTVGTFTSTPGDVIYWKTGRSFSNN